MEEDIVRFCDPGKYVAVIADIVGETLKNGNNVIRVYFKFKDRNKQYVELSAIFSYKLTPTCKLYKLLKAVGYEDCEVEDEIELDDILGEKVIIQVENQRKGKRQYSNIIDYKKYVSKKGE